MWNAYAVNTLRYDEAGCVNCDRCIEVCPHALFVRGEKAVKIVRQEECMECGACASNCPTGALEVRSGVGCATYLYARALFGEKKGSCACG